MSEQIERSAPIVYIEGERVEPKRSPGRPRTNPPPEASERPQGRPKNNPDVVPSQRAKVAEVLRRQDITLTEEEFELVWATYCDLRRIFTEDQLNRYWHWRCQGCQDGDSQGHAVLNNRHHEACDTLDQTLKYCWPREVVIAVCAAKGIEVRF